MATLRWTKVARDDLQNVAEYYATTLDEAEVVRTVAAILSDINRVAESSLLARYDARFDRQKEPYQYWNVYHNRYRVYFMRSGPDEIKLYRIWSTRRPPLKPNDIRPRI